MPLVPTRISRSRGWLGLAAIALVAGPCAAGISAGSTVPSRANIVLILADDLGYGDVRALNPEGKLLTPHLDRLAGQGMIFRDAHSSSSVCTPTRYSLLTGRYNWRSRLKNGVLWGYSRRLIEPERMTVASMLGRHGYHTACVGKWHLGMDWPLKTGGFAADERDAWNVDYAKPIPNGPTTVGFDEFYGISASLDMPPYVYIEQDRSVGIPTVEKAFHRKGPAHEDFEAIDVLPTLTEKAVDYIHRRAPHAKQGTPFFLYFALTAPHTPILPTGDWQGKSTINAYGDFVMQVDAAVGQVLDALERNGLAQETLVIFTSDNGCSPAANFAELAAHGHHPSYQFRGHKADIFEGGHRIPLIVRWPGKVRAGATSDQLTCLVDFFATCADLIGAALPNDAAEDSVSILPALLETAEGPLRETVVHHSVQGKFAIREGHWKLCLCPGSGGWSDPRPESEAARLLPPVQLYRLEADIGERQNLRGEYPEVVKRLRERLLHQVEQGRSTPESTAVPSK
jgi:arylsulfatase A-like enzyme